MKKSTAFVAILLAALALVGCAKKDETTLTMVTEATFPPYEFLEGDQIVGIDVSICQAVADSLGKTLVVQDQKFDSVIPSLIAGKADLAAAGITVTEERKQNVDFSIPYVTTGIAIIRKTGDEAITGADSLVGKRVGVQSGTTSDTYLVDEMKQEPERYDSPAAAVAALKAGRCDAVVADIDPATAITTQDRDVEMLPEPLSQEDYAVAVRKGNTELLDAINAVIARIKADGTYDAFRADAQARFDALNAAAIGSEEPAVVEEEAPAVEVEVPAAVEEEVPAAEEEAPAVEEETPAANPIADTVSSVVDTASEVASDAVEAVKDVAAAAPAAIDSAIASISDAIAPKAAEADAVAEEAAGEAAAAAEESTAAADEAATESATVAEEAVEATEESATAAIEEKADAAAATVSEAVQDVASKAEEVAKDVAAKVAEAGAISQEKASEFIGQAQAAVDSALEKAPETLDSAVQSVKDALAPAAAAAAEPAAE